MSWCCMFRNLQITCTIYFPVSCSSYPIILYVAIIISSPASIAWSHTHWHNMLTCIRYVRTIHVLLQAIPLPTYTSVTTWRVHTLHRLGAVVRPFFTLIYIYTMIAFTLFPMLIDCPKTMLLLCFGIRKWSFLVWLVGSKFIVTMNFTRCPIFQHA